MNAIEILAKYNDTSVIAMQASLDTQFAALRCTIRCWRSNGSDYRDMPVTDAHLCTWMANRGPVSSETIRHAKAGPAWLELAREAIKGF